MDKADTGLNSHNLAFVEDLYTRYLENATSVSENWQAYFKALENGISPSQEPHFRQNPSFKPRSLFAGSGSANQGSNGSGATQQDSIDRLVHAYRVYGHMTARIDPLGLRPSEQLKIQELDPLFYGINGEDQDRPCHASSIISASSQTPRKIIQQLHNTYCRSIGAQFMHIENPEIRHWLTTRMEGSENRCELSRDKQIRILQQLNDAVMFEEFIQRKYQGAKSFSLEGAESLIPLLGMAIEKAGSQGAEEIVLGMAHRGRLNVLANIMGKGLRDIFNEFDDDDDTVGPHGDVKYHMGYSTDWETSEGKKVHLSLCFNASHLEFVSPVVMGRVRSKQDRFPQELRHERCIALVIHGDAAMAGEGVVQETFNLSQLQGYSVGGSIHVVLNNQIGFTTTPNDDRSSSYASDVAKMLQIPIFHVNGEDPEAVAQAIELALDFRYQFKRDVVIDMYCYRKRGHNESDEPSYTQPLLYKTIKKRKSVRESYLQHLLKQGGISAEEAQALTRKRREELESELAIARKDEGIRLPETMGGIWQGYQGGALSKEDASLNTGIGKKELMRLLEALTRFPEGFNLHPKLKRFIDRRKAIAEGEPVDWASAEALAFASLVAQNIPIRLSGQDSERGTFSQRHSIFHDYENGLRYSPLAQIQEKQANFDVYNSPLSEIAVLAFDYGYSLDKPQGLVLWEGQFGDFSNVAQTIIDQFIVSAEEKWRRLSGLVMLLPHGYEGMGPEHSSARLERFLSLAANDNIQVVNPTTPAQYFHLLRRQVIRKWRKPLVVMTPKSLLRSPDALSNLEELEHGSFQPILPDTSKSNTPVSRVLICSGKVYFDLVKEREAQQRQDVAIIRIEELYPLPAEKLISALAAYPDDTPVFWVQEEPENMGAWQYFRIRFGEALEGRLRISGIYRPRAASPATGSASRHRREQRELVEQAFASA